MTKKKVFTEIKNNKIPHDYEFISNDPKENADNFDPKWNRLRDLNTDEERYKTLKKIWGNPEIPDPRINLTCRYSNYQSESQAKENCSTVSSSSKTRSVHENYLINKTRRKVKVSKRRSRSCTKPYEQLISNLEKDYDIEYSQMMNKHKTELQKMLQIHFHHSVLYFQKIYSSDEYENFENKFTQYLKILQEQQVNHLLINQFKEVQHFLGEKNQNIEACKRYMEEVKAFFTFYQKINNNEVDLQMTDEQYEHTTETEKMYSLYSVFYR